VLDKIIVNTVDLQAIKVIYVLLNDKINSNLIYLKIFLKKKQILIEDNFNKDPILYNNFGYPYGIRFLGQGLVTGKLVVN
jgi:hypothetical protein